ncbi:MAG: hypothetical protein IKP68_00250, partial [Clostridia bacterium]|nr:hypothetical protein [Clostridia bacterium]
YAMDGYMKDIVATGEDDAFLSGFSPYSEGIDAERDLAKLYTFLEGKGYDSIKYENQFEDNDNGEFSYSYILFDSNQVKSADPVTYDDDGNVIPLSERFNTEESDIRYQPVEETKDLLAIHNLTQEELLKSLQLGGLPMPSIAVIKAKQGHARYGDVSLIFNKETIDPQARRENKVYGGDVWSPVYPTIEYKANEKNADAIRNTYYTLARKYGYDALRPMYNYAQDLQDQLNRDGGEKAMLNRLYDDTDMMNVYLLSQGKDSVQDVVRETVTKADPEDVRMYRYFIDSLGEEFIRGYAVPKDGSPTMYRKAFLTDHAAELEKAYGDMLRDLYRFSEEEVKNAVTGVSRSDLNKLLRGALTYLEKGTNDTVKTEVDTEATNQAIRDVVDEAKYRAWIDELFKGVEEKSGIRNNKEFFTPSGDRRSFEALHYENNLENVVRVMREQNNGSTAFFGGQGIWSASAKEYKTIADLKKDAARLRLEEQEYFEELQAGYGKRLTDIAMNIRDKSESNQFIAMDNAMECIVDAIRSSNTKEGMLRYLKGFTHLQNINMETVDKIAALVKDISEMPTEYFEAKPRRAVMLNEIATAVIPSNASLELKDALDRNGVKYVEYEPGNEEERRSIMKTSDARFQAAAEKDPTDVTKEDVRTILEGAKAKYFKDGTYLPVRINTPSLLIEAARRGGIELKDVPAVMSVYKM